MTFDGIRFTAVDEMDGVSMANIWVTHLLEDEGTLWIGTSQDGLIALRNGKVTRYSRQNGLPSDTVQCLLADGRGNVWVCTPKGLAEFSGEKVRVVAPAPDLSAPDIRTACLMPDGSLIVGTDTGSIATWDGTPFAAWRRRVPESATVQAMLCSTAGTLWIGTSDGLVRVDGERERRFTLADGLAGNSILTLTEGRDGAIFAGTTNGFSRLRAKSIESFRPQDGLSQSSVYSVYEDGEGSLWVATKHGLNQFLDGRAIPYTTSEGLPSNNTGPVFQDRAGTIWVGTIGTGLARFDGRRFVALTTRNGLASDSIYALAEDETGDLWVGTDAGLNRLRHGRVTGTWTVAQGLPGNRIRSLFLDSAGTLWIATSAGPAVYREGHVRPVSDPRDVTDEPIQTFGENFARQVVAAPDVESPLLRHGDAMYSDREGLLWVGTLGDGLRLVDNGRVFSFSVRDGLFDDVIYGIAEDDRGLLWMACSKGIFSVNRSDLRQLAAGKLHSIVSTPYSPLDALRTIECRLGVEPTIWRLHDGRLLFSTIRGVLVIDPNRTERRFAPPAVAIDDVTVDGERKRLTDVGELPAGHNTIEFGYTGLSFVAPTRITFRYMLEGFDKTWVAAGPRRQAFYTNLPHGRFQFRVIACNPEDMCSETPAVLAFMVQPRYYQRAWFFPLCGGWRRFLAGACIG